MNTVGMTYFFGGHKIVLTELPGKRFQILQTLEGFRAKFIKKPSSVLAPGSVLPLHGFYSNSKTDSLVFQKFIEQDKVADLCVNGTALRPLLSKTFELKFAT